MASIHSNFIPNLSFNRFQAPPSAYLVGAGIVQPGVILSNYCRRKRFPCIKCEKEDEEHIKHVSVERPPYSSYFDSTSGELEPASGARASIPSQEYWPEGTASRVRAARAPAPTAESSTSPSYGAKPGSRRKNYKASVPAASFSSEPVVEFTGDGSGSSELLVESSEDSQDHSSDFVVYQSEPVEEELSEYEFNKRVGLPHPFVDPKAKKPIEGVLPNEELWWNWQQPEKEQWSRWQRRKPDVETVFLKAMAETGQIKLHGEEPTLTETALYRARREIYKEERLQAEQERLERDGPIAYYSEWVKAWKRDTSREAIQKHFEETGEDENTQLIEMFSHQTDREYRVMMGTDYRIQRDPLAMRMREDQIKQIWGGDPVYPTVNYIQDPNEVIDYRGPNFHEPTPNMVAYLKEVIYSKILSLFLITPSFR
ncbi:protein PLASTID TRANSCRIPTIONALLY ACTIVE 12, chloroplastic isoform X2 [Vigna angularis]|uniref:protein PLASTID TRANSCRIPTIONALLY ACTIVE 12, chloroplastic isoform X2 n=1 Tax=Phaseolus angularis TaxID=3914 RepID=UPI0022B41952|nr:protein PLASTID TRANSCRIPTIONALLY ACTIVE 12, chloroplastic isoform X2 [Vigna angularis]